jgi:ABC-type uncharacterized transport system involved in gliding motility auxiliary subunit
LTVLAAVAGLAGLLIAAALLTVRQRGDTAVYIGVVVAIVGFTAALFLDRERLLRLARGRQARYGTNAMLGTFALLAILTLLNIVAIENPKSWDLTEDRQFSLAPETIATLKALDSDVQLIGFYSVDRVAERDALRPLLQQYQETGGRVSYEFVDPFAQPFRAREYGVVQDASLVVALGQASEVTTTASEQAITESIVRLTHPGSRKVYFLTGHGERDLQADDEQGFSQLRQTLESKNYTVETLSLLVAPQVPDDALAVVVAGPTAPLNTGEVQALTAYLDHGGGLVVLDDPTPEMQDPGNEDPLEAYLGSAWGITLQPDLNVDPSSVLELVTAIADRYATHPVTDRLQGLYTYFPTSRSLQVEESAGNVTRTPLVLTGSTTWGETNLDQNAPIEFNDGEDAPGPLIVAATADDTELSSRVIVIGDSDFGANADFSGYGNGDLLVNSIDWAAGQDDLINLTPKPSIERYVAPPSRPGLLMVALLSIVVVPAAFLTLGVATWWGRRAKA